MISFCRKKNILQHFPLKLIAYQTALLEAKYPLKTQLLPSTKLSYCVKAEAFQGSWINPPKDFPAQQNYM